MIIKDWNIKDILTLSYIKGLTFNSIKKIVEGYYSFKEFLSDDRPSSFAANLHQNELFGNMVSNALSTAEEQIGLCENASVSIVSLWDQNYPSLLKQISGAPVLLFVKGDLQKPESTSISMVGTRKNTLYGRLCTEKFSEFFARNNVIVTSGLAYGIDSIAHDTVIRNKGITYAVIASGIDTFMANSRFNNKLGRSIVDAGGAIISEYKCGVVSLPAYFPQRNRIISGISLATLVVESDEKGGALITARFAFDQQRELFAVPGNINSNKSRGTNNLIKNNMASIAVSPETLFETLGLIAQNGLINGDYSLIPIDKEDRLLFEILSYEPVHIDELADKTNMELPELLVKLLDFEFKGLVRQLPGKYYIKK